MRGSKGVTDHVSPRIQPDLNLKILGFSEMGSNQFLPLLFLLSFFLLFLLDPV